MVHPLTPLLAPRSIAVIGASADPSRIGGVALDHLRREGFPGSVYPVHPERHEVLGYRCYASIEALPEVPDVAVIALRAPSVLPMLERCAALGVPAAVVYAAGFAEAGAQGAALQSALQAFAQRTGMKISGPNCLGSANIGARAYTTFAGVFRDAPSESGAGRIGILTQSGNVCTALYELLRRMNVGVSHFVNTGNEAAIEFSDYLEYLADDPQTQCVVGYVEQLRDGQRFVRAALEFAAQDKLLVIYKAGETVKGSEAVRSHTAALAGDLSLYRAVFRQLNVVEAEDFTQMADLAWLSGFSRRSGGTRLAVVSVSGAMGAVLADRLTLAGLELPDLPAEVQQALRANIPDYGMVANPVDITGNVVNASAAVRAIMEELAATPALDVVVVNAPGYLLDRMADVLIDVSRKSGRLFVVVDTGSAGARTRLITGGVPVFDDFGRAVRALAPYCRWLAQAPSTRRWAELRKTLDSDTSSGRGPVAEPIEGRDEHQIKRWLAGFGVPAVQEAVATDADAAALAAQRIGFPVALKVLSADIAHKTEVGGVRLGLTDAQQVRAAFRDIMASIREKAPLATVSGALVQKQSRGAVELIVGVTVDPVFGQALTVGLGGVLTELYKDVTHRLLPVDDALADEMLRELRAFPLLDGFRGAPKADIRAACRAIAGIAAAAHAQRTAIAQIEVNPLHVLAEGVIVIDALVLAAADGNTTEERR